MKTTEYLHTAFILVVSTVLALSLVFSAQRLFFASGYTYYLHATICLLLIIMALIILFSHFKVKSKVKVFQIAWWLPQLFVIVISNHMTNPVESYLSSATTSLGPFPKGPEVGLLLAASDSLGASQLLYWNTISGLDTTESDYYQIGSLTSYHSALTPQVLSRIDSGNLAPDRLLSVVTAVVQSYGIHDNLVEQNICGLVFGLRTHAGKTIWQEDTNFVLYDPQIKNPIWISALVRDNVVVIYSSQTHEVRCLSHSVSTASIQDWAVKWQDHVKSHLKTDRYRYWVFISILGKVITVLRRDNLDEESRYVSLRNIGDGKYDMGISKELMSLLIQPLLNRHDGSLPFRLNFRND